MARCEVCGRKIKPTERFCGKDKCAATTQFPRCIKCGRLIYQGQKELCPATKQQCQPDNADATIPTRVKFMEVK